MGFLAAQMNRSAIKSIRIEVEGEISDYAKSLLTFGIVGSLKEAIEDKINYVNAAFVAEEKGIETKYEVVNSTSGYKNKITITLTTEKNVTSISGTVFGEDEQRIVGINGFKFDFKPKGKMIIFKNHDVPGVVANIATILANEGINIADFRLGRGAHQFAMAVILVDTNIDKKIITQLNKLETCVWVEYAVL